MPSACVTTTYSDGDVDNSKAMFSGVRNIFVYGDGTTSACLDDATTPGTICVEGNAVPAGSDYAAWGAGIGLQLSATDMSGNPIAPWDATALGIAALKFTVSNLTASRPLRVQLAQVNDPAITTAANNYQENGFLRGGTKATKATEGENIVEFTNFMLPAWAAEKIAEGLGTPDAATELEGTPVDGAKLHQLQFQIANEPKDDAEPYKYCLSDLQWVDAAGNQVAVVVPADSGSSSGDTGSATGSGSGGSDSTSGVSDSTSGGSDSTSGGSDSSTSGSSDSSGGLLSYAADIQPILEAKCSGCHASTGTAPNKWYGDGTMEPGAGIKAEIYSHVDDGSMPPGGATQLTDDEKALVLEWSDE